MKLVEIIESIYDSEIPCRIEWMFDGGFTWSIQNGNFPRIWKDDRNGVDIITETDEHFLQSINPLLEKDWVERGSNYSFTEAIKELSNAICKHFPDSKFAKWYKIN
jgi:hypothetical protein